EEMDKAKQLQQNGQGRRGAEGPAGAMPGMAWGTALRKGDGADRELAKDAKRAEPEASAPTTPPAEAGVPPAGGVPPTVRKNFADTAFWAATLVTNKDGVAEVSLTMPENLTGWKVKTWALGHGTKVGQGEAEVTTKKDLLVRLQAPRFFVQK